MRWEGFSNEGSITLMFYKLKTDLNQYLDYTILPWFAPGIACELHPWPEGDLCCRRLNLWRQGGRIVVRASLRHCHSFLNSVV